MKLLAYKLKTATGLSLALAAVLAALLAGCGGGGGGGGEVSSATDGTPTTQPQTAFDRATALAATEPDSDEPVSVDDIAEGADDESEPKVI